MDDLIDTARQWFARNHAIALATVVRTWGSSPRPAGSHLLVRDDGLFEGSVSGGCIEADVVTNALEVLKSGAPRLIKYGVSQEKVWDAGLTCGGTVHVYIETLSVDHFAAGLGDDARTSNLLARVIDTQELRAGYVDMSEADPALGLTAEQLATVRQMLKAGHNRGLDHADKRVAPQKFVCTYGPTWRLVVVGAVHITQALAPMAQQAGFSVTIIDPRGAFSARERFSHVAPDVDLISEWPDEVLPTLGLNERTAVVMLTHDEKLDDPAIVHALRAPVFYIGALGSRKTQTARNKRLEKRGVDPNEFKRIHGPVGLDIGAQTAGEIAVSVLAEVIAARHGEI